MKHWIGLDLGGTKLSAVLVNSGGDVIDYRVAPTGAGQNIQGRQGIKIVVAQLVDITRKLMESNFSSPPRRSNNSKLNLFASQMKQINGIGLASAGPMNVATGELIEPANFHGWGRVPLVDRLSTELELRGFRGKLYFQNDAIAASLAEGWLGAAKGLKSYVVITVGTGIGSGVIFNGQPAQSGGMGSEWGHMVVNMNRLDTHRNYPYTVEGIASGTAILRAAQELGYEGSTVRGIADLARNGDDKFRALFIRAAEALAILCYNLSMGFHLEKILVTGGVMHSRDLFFDHLKKTYTDLIVNKNKAFRAPIVLAHLQNQAGCIGAARGALLQTTQTYRPRRHD